MTAALRAGRRSLDTVDGVTVIGDWWWHQPFARWILQIRLCPSIEPNQMVPAETDWFVFAAPRYPRGPISLFPAKQDGISVTFPHQHYNGDAGPDAPWRLGDICLEDYLATLGRVGPDPEPEDADRRLRWRAIRALEWLTAAATGRLLPDGTPFELPDFPEVVDTPRVVINESDQSFDLWHASNAKWGSIEVCRPPDVPHTVVVQRFLRRGGESLYQSSWGHALSEVQGRPERGIWLRLDHLPVLPPWQAPATWGELRRLLGENGIDLDGLLRPALRGLRDRREHLALIGFPIPRTMGESDVQMHWQAFQLPILCSPLQAPDGYRPNEVGQWQADRYGPLRSDGLIRWLPTENWNPKEVAARGRLPDQVADKHLAIIGVGTLGSAVAELLVRAGVSRLTLIDADTLKAGNLVRHTLLLADLGQAKAVAVAKRLNLSNPNVHVHAIAKAFPLTDADDRLLQAADVVIDTTGSNDVVNLMAESAWGGTRLFVSISLGLGARRLYLYAIESATFPNEHFRAVVDPLVAEDYDRYEGDLPWEGIGCWHPVFPARSDDIWLLASASVKRMVGLMQDPSTIATTAVIEQVLDDGEFMGVRVR